MPNFRGIAGRGLANKFLKYENEDRKIFFSLTQALLFKFLKSLINYSKNIP